MKRIFMDGETETVANPLLKKLKDIFGSDKAIDLLQAGVTEQQVDDLTELLTVFGYDTSVLATVAGDAVVDVTEEPESEEKKDEPKDVPDSGSVSMKRNDNELLREVSSLKKVIRDMQMEFNRKITVVMNRSNSEIEKTPAIETKRTFGEKLLAATSRRY